MEFERRGSPRSSIDCVVHLMTAGDSWVARLKTISRLGALVRLIHPLAIGTPVSLVFRGPGFDALLELRGQVVRAEASEGAVDVAVMFAPLSSSTIWRVATLIAHAGAWVAP